MEYIYKVGADLTELHKAFDALDRRALQSKSKLSGASANVPEVSAAATRQIRNPQFYEDGKLTNNLTNEMIRKQARLSAVLAAQESVYHRIATGDKRDLLSAGNRELRKTYTQPAADALINTYGLSGQSAKTTRSVFGSEFNRITAQLQNALDLTDLEDLGKAFRNLATPYLVDLNAGRVAVANPERVAGRADKEISRIQREEEAGQLAAAVTAYANEIREAAVVTEQFTRRVRSQINALSPVQDQANTKVRGMEANAAINTAIADDDVLHHRAASAKAFDEVAKMSIANTQAEIAITELERRGEITRKRANELRRKVANDKASVAALQAQLAMGEGSELIDSSVGLKLANKERDVMVMENLNEDGRMVELDTRAMVAMERRKLESLRMQNTNEELQRIRAEMAVERATYKQKQAEYAARASMIGPLTPQSILDEQKRAREAARATTAAAPRQRRSAPSRSAMDMMFDDPGGFLGGGMASTLRYGIGASIMYGSFGLISEAVKDSEEFNVSLGRLESQLESVDSSGQVFRNMRADLVDLSKETGLLAGDLTEIATRMQGAFGATSLADGSGLMGNDGIVRAGEDLVQRQYRAAGMLQRVTGLTQKQISDELVAASTAFGVSADQIGDVIVKLEETTGVGSGELLNFIGDIGPSAQNAGYGVEEFAAIGATILKQSSVGSAALAEQFGRIMQSMSEDPTKFLELAYSSVDSFKDGDYNRFIEALQMGDAAESFKLLAQNYKLFNDNTKKELVKMLGGDRQANTLLSLFNDPAGMTRAEADANDAYGALEKKNAKLQEKVSYVLAQLDKTFNDLVKSFLDAGLIDAISRMASTLATVLDIVASIAGIFNTIDEVTGGTLSFVTGIAVQMGLIVGSALLLRSMRGPAAGAADIAGDVAAEASRARLRDRFGGFYNQARATNPTAMEAFWTARSVGNSGSGLAGAGSALRGARAGLAQGSRNLMAAMGPVGTGFMGLTLAVSAYGVMKGKIDKDKAEITRLMSEAAAGEKSASELRKEADRAANKDRGITRWFSEEILGNASEEEALDAAAGIKETKPFRDQLAQIAIAEQEYVNGLITGLTDAERDFREGLVSDKKNVFEETGTVKDINLFNILQDAGMLDDKTYQSGMSQIAKLGELSEEDLIKWYRQTAVAENPGRDPNTVKISNDFIENILKQNFKGIEDIIYVLNSPGDVLAGLGSLQAEFLESGNNEGNDILSAIIKSIEESDGAEVFKKYSDLSKSATMLMGAEAEDVAVALEAVLRGREEGSITVSEALAAIDKQITDHEAIKVKSETVEANLRALREARINIPTQALRAEADLLSEMAQVTRGDTVNNSIRDIARNLDLLDNTDFAEKTARRDAAMKIYNAMREQIDKMVDDAKTVEEIQKLMDEGIAVPLQAVAEEALGRARNNETYIKLAKDYDAMRDPNIEKTRGAQTTLDRSGLDQSLTASKLMSSVFAEIGRTGRVSAETTQKYIDVWSRLNDGLADAGISESERKALEGGIKFIENMFYEVRYLSGKAPKGISGFFSGARRNPFDKDAYAAPFGTEMFTDVYADADEAEDAMAKLAKEEADAAEDLISARLEIMKALAEDAGDIIAIAQIGIQQAEAALAHAKATGTEGDVLKAQAAIISARTALRQAEQEQRDAQANFLRIMTTGDDPVKQAEFDLRMAQIHEGEARGLKAQAEAAIARVEAERQLAAEMADLRMAQFELRQAQLNAIEDEVGSAQLSSQMLTAQLADAVSRGAGQAEITRIRAQMVAADKQVSDTLTQSKLDEYDYLLNTGKITQKQYVDYLEALKSTLDPASKQFKDLEVQLYQLKNSIGADLQMNLPTNLTLPTLYEARRLSQMSGGMGGGVNSQGYSVGYQDNRTMDVQISIGQNMSEDEIVTVLSNALGVGRNSFTPKRY